MTASSSWQDQCVLVTGGSRGIGRAIVEHLVQKGAKVAFTYQSRADAAEALIADLQTAPGQAIAFACDSRDFDAVKETVNQAREQLGGLHGLVNNAGITRDQILMMMKAEQWHEVIDTNLTGVFHFCKAVIFSMLKQRQGRIVNVGSVSGLIGNPGQVNYSAAKAGIIGLSKALAKETASRGITVNVVAPGFIETDMVGDIQEKTRETVLQMIPVGRFGEASEVASLVTYLLGQEAAYITGQVFTIDGGLAI
ncbi:MAG: 3-oxoacyl-[acyl-carrier-protein] reductase [Planctomycetota bacterium]|nr:MAG: 3-oxoacyl-[acyl-carrier-protein] reductase [Planctomycetota bacterium]